MYPVGDRLRAANARALSRCRLLAVEGGWRKNVRISCRLAQQILIYAYLLSTSTTVLSQRSDILERLGVSSIVSIEREIMIPMRDGVRLSTAIIRPTNVQGRLPTVLVRTPYPKEFELVHGKWLFVPLLMHGYALVLQNERGTGWSEGKHQFLAGARKDGYDTISWIAAQPWSNGKVGTAGCSSTAEDQLSLAALNHPAHRAMIAMAAGSGVGDIPGIYSQGVFYKGGVPQVGSWSLWYADSGSIYRPKLPDDISQNERVRLADSFSPHNTAWQQWLSSAFATETKQAPIDPYADPLQKSLREFPSKDILRRVGAPKSDFDTLITLSPADPFWKHIDFIHGGDKPRVPALHVTSWYDPGAYETIKLFDYLRDAPNQFLIVAPTSHCAMVRATEETIVGERSVGDARYDYASLFLNWFDYWLKGTSNEVLIRPKVQAYLMGKNVWKNYSSWPVAEAVPMRLFLHSKGGANGRLGDGRLSDAKPAEENPDDFISDPMHPVPSQGGGCCGSDVVQDQSTVELRKDVLVYSTDPLETGVAVTGEIAAVFYVSSSARDSDLALKLIDVYPDGRAFNLGDTMLRLRYRDGFAQPKLMKAGYVYRVRLRGLVTSNDFGPGHRIRIELAASNFPNAERNLQTGGKNYDEIKPVLANIKIFHDTDHQSFIAMPVVRE